MTASMTVMNDGIGQRVRAAIEALPAKRYDADIAAEIGLEKGAFSRSLSGKRAFTSIELAHLADILDADLHELITGDPDPLRPTFAARHDWDTLTREYTTNATDAGIQIRDGVVLGYQQAEPWLAAAEAPLPNTPDGLRSMLGDNFVREFADRVEAALGVDVVRLPHLDTDLSFVVAGQQVILLKSEANWFRSNWSLAHELGHLALGHHAGRDRQQHNIEEDAANEFAAELLLPAKTMRAIDWTAVTAEQIATFLWDTGVSTATLRNRIAFLNLPDSPAVSNVLSTTTQAVLNRHSTLPRHRELTAGLFTPVDPVGDRMRAAAERRIPIRLISALRDGIENGPLNTGTLAWLLDVDPEDLGIEERFAEATLSDDDLAALLGY